MTLDQAMDGLAKLMPAVLSAGSAYGGVEFQVETIPDAPPGMTIDAVASGEVLHVFYSTGFALIHLEGENSVWQVEIVESFALAEHPAPVGAHPAVAIDDQGNPWVAYLTGGCLRVAHREGGNWRKEGLTCKAGPPGLGWVPGEGPVVAFSGQGGVQTFRQVDGRWRREWVASDRGGGGVDAAISQDGTVHLVWEERGLLRYAFGGPGSWQEGRVAQGLIPRPRPRVATRPLGGVAITAFASHGRNGSRNTRSPGLRLFLGDEEGVFETPIGEGPTSSRRPLGAHNASIVASSQDVMFVAMNAEYGTTRLLFGEHGWWILANDQRYDGWWHGHKGIALTTAAVHVFESNLQDGTFRHAWSDLPTRMAMEILTVRKGGPLDWEGPEPWRTFRDETSRIEVLFAWHSYGDRIQGGYAAMRPRPLGGGDPGNWLLCGPDAPKVLGVEPADAVRRAFTLELDSEFGGDDFWKYAIVYSGPEGTRRFDFLDAWPPPWRPRKTDEWYDANCPA